MGDRIERRRKKKIKKRRKSNAPALFLLLILVALVFIVVHQKRKAAEEEKPSSIVESNSGMIAVGEAGDLLGGEQGDGGEESATADSVSADVAAIPGGYEGATNALSVINPNVPVDVTRGQAAVDLTQVSGGEYNKVHSAKAAMSTNAFFTGTTANVNTCLQKYGEGKWHAIRDVMGEICVFYEGVHVQRRTYRTGEVTENLEKSEEVPFRVVFTVYEDGSFQVTEVSEDNSNVEDWEAWLTALL